jgi:hypothetical protein
VAGLFIVGEVRRNGRHAPPLHWHAVRAIGSTPIYRCTTWRRSLCVRGTSLGRARSTKTASR